MLPRRMDKGFYRVARPFGVVLLAHWSLPLGALLAGGLDFRPLAWAAFVVLVVIHDVGHALLVRWTGMRALAWELTGFGGVCRWRGSASPAQRALIAWGGILAQVLVALTAWLATSIFGAPTTAWGQTITSTLIETNLWVLALNLLPIPPLDGAVAWGLFGHLGDSWRAAERRVLSSAQDWARARREARETGPDRTATRAHRAPSSSVSLRSTSQLTESAEKDAEEAIDEQPSVQAQAELAALLDRLARGKAKRK
jgi:stage IV sporulation protein FB